MNSRSSSGIWHDKQSITVEEQQRMVNSAAEEKMIGKILVTVN